MLREGSEKAAFELDGEECRLLQFEKEKGW
jgi:hypothetical protein